MRTCYTGWLGSPLVRLLVVRLDDRECDFRPPRVTTSTEMGHRFRAGIPTISPSLLEHSPRANDFITGSRLVNFLCEPIRKYYYVLKYVGSKQATNTVK